MTSRVYRVALSRSNLQVTLRSRREERERRKKVGWVVRDTTFDTGGKKAKFAAMKVPRQCPLVMVKVSWIGGKNVRKLRR
jgi:hypothetical protein